MDILTKKYLYCQQGAATALALGVMIVLMAMSGIVLVANNVLFSTNSQQNSAMANSAAEAGIRISTLILNESIKNKTGTNKYDIPLGLVGGITQYQVGMLKEDGTPDTNVYYTVNVQSSTSGQKILYTLTVTGNAYNLQKTIIGRYTATQSTPPPPLPPNIPNITMLVHNGGAHNGNDKLTIHPSYLLDKDGNSIPIYTTAKSNKIFNSTIWGPNIIKTVQKDAQLPPIPISFDWKQYDNDQTNLPESLNESANLSGNYYQSKNFNQNTGTITALNGNHVRIYAKGDINIYGNIITDNQTNITLIAGRNVNINTLGTIKGNIQIFAEGSITINRSMQGSILCMSKGDTTINVGHLRYAYMISYGDMTVYGNNSLTSPVTLIEGAIIAGQKLEVNGPTLIFNPNVISQWGTWPPGITYP